MSIFNTDLTPEELSWEMFDFYFPQCHKLYLITIKPKRGNCKLKWVANDFCKYLRNKGDITHFWIVPSISETEYKHFHGVVQLDDKCDSQRTMLTLRAKVNRGFDMTFDFLPINGNRQKVYKYIKNQKDTTYEHGSMLYITILE